MAGRLPAETPSGVVGSPQNNIAKWGLYKVNTYYGVCVSYYDDGQARVSRCSAASEKRPDNWEKRIIGKVSFGLWFDTMEESDDYVKTI